LDRRILSRHGVDPHGDAAWGLAFTLAAAAAALSMASLVTFAVEWPLLRARPFASEFARVTEFTALLAAHGRGGDQTRGLRGGQFTRVADSSSADVEKLPA